MQAPFRQLKADAGPSQQAVPQTWLPMAQLPGAGYQGFESVCFCTYAGAMHEDHGLHLGIERTLSDNNSGEGHDGGEEGGDTHCLDL